MCEATGQVWIHIIRRHGRAALDPWGSSTVWSALLNQHVWSLLFLESWDRHAKFMLPSFEVQVRRGNTSVLEPGIVTSFNTLVKVKYERQRDGSLSVERELIFERDGTEYPKSHERKSGRCWR